MVVHTCDVIILKAEARESRVQDQQIYIVKLEKKKRTQTKCDCEQENKNEPWGLGEYMSSEAKITDAFKGLGSGTAAAIC